MTRGNNNEKFRKQKGFGLPEMLIVVLIISIIGVLALPRIISSRRLTQLAETQKQIGAAFSEARREAVSQQTPITIRYDDINKIIVVYGGNYGALSDAGNRVVAFSDFGLEKSDIAYGRPNGVPESPLTDTTNLTPLTENSVEMIFQPDGSASDAAKKAQNNALFFYYKKYAQDAAFAVSILGADGRVMVWGYSKNIKDYIEKKH